MVNYTCVLWDASEIGKVLLRYFITNKNQHGCRMAVRWNIKGEEAFHKIFQTIMNLRFFTSYLLISIVFALDFFNPTRANNQFFDVTDRWNPTLSDTDLARQFNVSKATIVPKGRSIILSVPEFYSAEKGNMMWVKGNLASTTLILGSQSADTVRMSEGGSWIVKDDPCDRKGGQLIVGQRAGQEGYLRIAGGTVDVGSLNIGWGTVALTGGTLSTEKILGEIGHKQLILNGGTIKAKANYEKDFICNFLPGEFVLGPEGGTIDTNGYRVRIAGAPLSGYGGLTIANLYTVTCGCGGQTHGVLIFSDANTYLGTTIVREKATLLQGKKNTFSSNSNVFVEEGAILDLGGFDGTIGGLLGQVGSIVTNNRSDAAIKDGNDAATFTIGNNNGHGYFWGDIRNGKNAVLSLRKVGSGTQVLTENNTYTGRTYIESGQLVVNAHLASSQVSVHHNSILSGIGTIAGNVDNSGIMSPGNSIGTFRIRGNYIQTDQGILFIEIADRDSYDKLMVRGTATLGGRLRIGILNGFVPRGGSEFTVVEAEHGIIGELLLEGDNFPGALKLEVFYEGDVVGDGKRKYVKIKMVQGKFTGKTPMQNSIGKAINKAIDDEKAYGQLGEAIWVLQFIPRDQVGPYLELLAPMMAMNIKDVLLNATNIQYGQLNERLAAVREGAGGVSLNGLSQEPMAQQASAHEANLYHKNIQSPSGLNIEETSPWSLFANASGIFSKITSAMDLPKQRAITGYFSAGGDRRIGENISVGAYMGYQGIKSWYSNGSRLRSNGVKSGIYSTGQWKGFYANALLGSGFNSLEMNRIIHLGHKKWKLTSYPNVWELNSMLGGGYEVPLGPWRLGINNSLQYTYMGISSFTESGAGNLNVKVGKQNPYSLVNTLGASISYHWEPTARCKLIPKIGLSWQHEFLNYGENVSAAFGNGVGPGFQLRSTTGARNNAFGSAGFMAQLGSRLSGYCYYNPQFGGGDIVSHGLLVGLNYNF